MGLLLVLLQVGHHIPQGGVARLGRLNDGARSSGQVGRCVDRPDDGAKAMAALAEPRSKKASA